MPNCQHRPGDPVEMTLAPNASFALLLELYLRMILEGPLLFHRSLTQTQSILQMRLLHHSLDFSSVDYLDGNRRCCCDYGIDCGESRIGALNEGSVSDVGENENGPSVNDQLWKKRSQA